MALRQLQVHHMLVALRINAVNLQHEFDLPLRKFQLFLRFLDLVPHFLGLVCLFLAFAAVARRNPRALDAVIATCMMAAVLLMENSMLNFRRVCIVMSMSILTGLQIRLP